MPTKKYLNRDKEEKTAADDEWAHLTGIETGPKLQVADALDIQSRNIFVSGKKQKAVSTTDIIQEKETKEKKSVDAIQDELKILGELYGMDKISNALKRINESGGSD